MSTLLRWTAGGQFEPGRYVLLPVPGPRAMAKASKGVTVVGYREAFGLQLPPSAPFYRQVGSGRPGCGRTGGAGGWGSWPQWLHF